MSDHAAVRDFLQRTYRHFNAGTIVDAAAAWTAHLARGDRMFLSMAGAMSTAEIGILLAELIRREKVHAICCTGANLEEDLFHLVACSHYRKIPQWRHLSPEDEETLAARGLNRVTDTCIPEEEAMRHLESLVARRWQAADRQGEGRLPHEFFYDILRAGELPPDPKADPANSWMLAAAEKDLPLFVPGWEDSTLGNFFVAQYLSGKIRRLETVRSGLRYMERLVHWYRDSTTKNSLGFFQIGGGIAGDFPICVVPLIRQDLEEEVPLWSYFCQISDSTTSYGSYSGAVPNEKITWGKLAADTPKFMIESDATIVAPLIFSYLLAE